ncbi:MAG: autotransporter domain-containing protein [Steroidobacter sp.]
MSLYLQRAPIGNHALVLSIFAAALLAQNSLAAPPTITGASVTAEAPIQRSLTINLRELGVIAGSAPLVVQPESLLILVNGQPESLLSAQLFPNNGPGRVCVTLSNIDFTANPNDTYALQLAVGSLSGSSIAGPVIVPLTNTPGPEVDTSVEQAACNDPNTQPVANAGPDRTVPDTDGLPGESVILDGAASTDADAGTVLSYQWFLNDSALAPSSSSPALTVNLPAGVHDVSLIVTDDSEDPQTDTNSDSVQITVSGAQGPTADAGPPQTLNDSDGQPGEPVTLTATASDADGTIASYEWRLGDTLLGTTQSLQTTLPDGVNDIVLTVTDNAGLSASDTVRITIAAAPEADVLSELPNLTPNQQKVAIAVDRICNDLAAIEQSEGALTRDQQQLLERCNGLLFNNSADNQIEALDELVADDFAAARTQTLLFANTQYASIMDRLIALRGGAKGLSLAGLNIIVDGKMVPLAQLQDIAKEVLGGGASADEPGGLLSDKWGLWARGNYSFGEKDANSLSPSFDADQWSIVGGVDYRLSDKAVVGVSLSYGDSSVEFNPSDEGSLDTESWAASLYGSVYAAKNFYFDGILNVANSSYDARRNITYVDGLGLVDVDASGDTDGLTISGGLSGGYDFLIGGLTVSPNLGFFYIDTTIDSFTEQGAGGLNLIYDEQAFESLTGNLGLRLTYAWNLSWGVLLPHLRVDYVREFEDDVDVFGVRFASDPNATSTPAILIETDNPDTSYWRLATGFSAQFKYGLSGYVEYQRLESFEFISFEDVSVGLRMQRSF